MPHELVSGISSGFPGLSQSQGQVTHVLLTRSPLITRASPGSPFDLHVLSTPPAFVLSQNQTLRKCQHGTRPTKAGRQPTHETGHPPARQATQVRSDQIHPPPKDGPSSAKPAHHTTGPPTRRRATRPCDEPNGIDYLAHC